MEKDKRKYPRVKGAFVEYALKDNGVFQGPAFIKDISIGGLCIFVTEVLQQDALVDMKIYLMGYEEPILAQGRVVWQGKIGYLNYHDMGVEFTKLEDEDHKRLEDYIMRHLDGKFTE